MRSVKSTELGELPIGTLLFRQGLPAGIGILVMSLNNIVDTIFVGNWIGSTAIAGINVVLPISFFMAAVGMAIGVGGASIISRALGANNRPKAFKTFGNQITLSLVLTVVFVFFGLLFVDSLIPLFGGKGDIFKPAKIYYEIILYGVPFQALSMMSNTVIRSEGKPKYAMIAMIIPSVINLLFDYILINYFDMGMAGAAWASTISYVLSFSYSLWFFLSDRSELKIKWSDFGLDRPILKEMSSLGLVTLSRQGVRSVMFFLVNNLLYNFGGTASVAVFGILGRMLMFAYFPILGVMQGFLPIAGFNYGAQKWGRVRESIKKAFLYAFILALFIFIIIQIFPESIASVFTSDANVIEKTPLAMRLIFAALPVIGFQIISAAYFQAIGKAKKALVLALLRQGILFIPLVLILPEFFDVTGVWLAFFSADILATVITVYYIYKELRYNLIPK